MKNNCSGCIRGLLTGVFVLALGCSELLAQSGIYVGGHFRRERNHTIADLKASGFTYVILFNVNVEPNGDLTTDGQTVCSNGNYVYGATNPDYISDVNSLKTGATSINRIETCIGGWGNHSYTNIRNLVNSQGVGTGSILYRNFRALKNALPIVEAINNDDEEAYDANSATAFHVMLADIGYKTTLAPYMNRGYWQSLATNVNNQRSGAVDKIYLQWYEGGAGNNPCDWNINNIELHTGDLYYENGTTVANKMISARNNCRSRGGFYWVYNDNNINLKEIANRVNTIFGVQPPPPNVAMVYKNCNYDGTAVSLPVGNYTLGQLLARGILNDDISSLRVNGGYQVVLYEDDNFGGASLTVRGDNGCLVGNALGAGTWNDKPSSLRVQPASSSFSTTIQAEAYSNMSGVQVEACSEGGQNVGWIDQGDWMAYFNVNFPSSGAYTIEYRVASYSGSRLSSDLNAGAIQLGNVTIPATGGWQNWTTVSQTVNVNAGTYNFGVYAQAGGWNLNWIRISKVGGRPAANTATAAASLASEAQALQLYPNPVADRLTLTGSLALAGNRYYVLDAYGKTKMNGVVAAGGLDVAALPAGSYTLVVVTEDQQKVSRRFVK